MSDPRLDPRAAKPSSTDGDIWTTVGGVVAWAPPAAPSTRVLPWTTTVNGVPDLVWDANNELVLIEVAL